MAAPGGEFERPSAVRAVLRGLTWLGARCPGWTLLVCVVTAVLCAQYTQKHLTMKTSRADLIDPNTEYHRRWLAYTESFGETPDMIVTVEAESPETIKEILDDLGPRVEAETQLFQNVLYKIDPGPLRRKGLQYLSPDQLELLLKHLDELAPVLRGEWKLMTLRNMVRDARGKLGQASAAGDFGQSMAEPLVLQIDHLVISLSKFIAERDYDSPLDDLIPLDRRQREQAHEVRYLLNDKGTMGFLQTQPVVAKNDFAGAAVSIDRMRVILKSLQKRYPTARVGLTGIPVLECDEMRDSEASMTNASILSFVGVTVLLLIGFRGFKHPLIGMAMLTVAMCWAFGFTTYAVGHLNILSISFATMLIGLGVDYTIVYLSRYLELRHEGLPLYDSLMGAAVTVGPGTVTSAMTTAVSFLTALLINFTGIAELGLIAGGGVLLCCLASFLVVPALVTIFDRRTQPAHLPAPIQGNGLRMLISKYPAVLCAASFAAIATLAMHAVHVKYDYNLLNMQAHGLESVDVQDRIFQQSDGSVLYAVAMADSPEKAKELKKKFLALPTVRHVEEVASMLPKHSHVETKLQVQGVNAQLAKLPMQPFPAAVVNPEGVGQELQEVETLLAAWNTPTAAHARKSIGHFLELLSSLSFEDQKLFLLEYQTRLKNDMLTRLQMLSAASDPRAVTAADLPAPVAARFVSNRGWLLQVYPQTQVWSPEPLAAFVRDVRSVDPDVTGTPLQTYEATNEIFRGYLTVGGYALIATCLITLLDFKNILHVGLSLLPSLLGMTMTLGFMGWFHVDLNPANLIILPLIMGVGVDGGVHVVHDYLAQGGRYRMSSSLINALILNSTTTTVGFGSMMLAHHRGLFSVGLVLTIGVNCCLFVTLVLLPALLTLLPARAARHVVRSSTQGFDPEPVRIFAPQQTLEAPAPAALEAPVFQIDPELEALIREAAERSGFNRRKSA